MSDVLNKIEAALLVPAAEYVPAIGDALKIIAEARAALPKPAEPPTDFPAMTPELARILGTMCFQCISFAQALRTAGHQIEKRAEAEQAATLHWMLGHYFRHGEDWRKHASEDMERMREAHLAKGGAQ